MFLIIMILQLIVMVEILVAHATVVMIRAVHVVLPAGSVGDEVAVTNIADEMVQRVVLVLREGSIVLEVPIAPVTVRHGSAAVEP